MYNLENIDINKLNTKEEIAVEAFKVILAINGGCITRRRCVTGHKPTAFFEFYGYNEGNIEIVVNKTGWFSVLERDTDAHTEEEFYQNLVIFRFFEDYKTLEEEKDQLKKLVALAKELTKEEPKC